MIATTRTQKKYDHRLRELVRSTGDIEHAIQQGVPRSTARGWLTAPCAEIVAIDVVDRDALRLQQEILALLSVTTFCSFLREFSPLGSASAAFHKCGCRFGRADRLERAFASTSSADQLNWSE